LELFENVTCPVFLDTLYITILSRVQAAKVYSTS